MDCRERLNWSLALLLAFWASGWGSGLIEPPRKEDVKKIMEISVQHFDKVEQVKYPWGWIRWLMNSKLDPGAAQTFGVVEIAAGQRNSLHMHPNCEELLRSEEHTSELQ